MAERSLIIIGGGLAGLSAGIYAQLSGYRAHIFEHHTAPGGVCAAWKRKGYTIDGCIHWLMGARPGDFMHRIYEEVGALEGNRLLYLDHYARFVDEASGAVLDVTSYMDRLAADMRALAPEDGRAIDQIIGGARSLCGVDMEMPGPRELMGPWESISGLWRMRRFMLAMFRYRMSVRSFTERIQSPALRHVLNELFTPTMPMVFLFALLAQLADGRLAGVEGGSRQFSEAVARRYEKLGGEITYGAMVEEILVEDDRAVGVRLADGSEHRADAVISAADGHSTIFGMLKGRYASEKIKERYESWPLFPPIHLVTFGVAREFPGEPPASVLFLREPLPTGGKESRVLWLRVFNEDPELAPVGKTVVQAMVETDFDTWMELSGDRPRYEAEKALLAEAVLERLEGHLPGIASHVEMTDVATPHTFWRYTRNHRAAYEGWLMTPEMMTAQVEKTLPGLDNFYMAGQWVEPGGGIPAVLLSGRNAVRLLCHRDGRPFVAAAT